MEEIISIVVPVYNCERFIEETIRSVLNQTYQKFELILVNDCSRDNSVNVIQDFKDSRIRLINQPQNMGAYAARNRGVSEASGRYIAFLDADDLWDPVKLEHELNFMHRENAGFVFTGYEFADEQGVGSGKVVRVPGMITYEEALGNTTIFTSTVLIDRTKVSDDLIMMPNIPSEDTATWWNILKAGNIAHGLDENLVRYRRSAGTLSSNKLEAVKRIWNLYRKIAGLSVAGSCRYMFSWAIKAVKRRL